MKSKFLRGLVVATIIVASIAVVADHARTNVIAHFEAIPKVIEQPGNGYPPVPECGRFVSNGAPIEYADCILSIK